MAIATMYRGVEYRSRLEARWASFFDYLGWSHTYEPFDADGYIPDFVIHGKRPLLIEIKPAVLVEDYKAPVDKVLRGVRAHWRHDILILGVSPFSPLNDSFDGVNAGWLGEFLPADEWNEYELWEFGPAPWTHCGNCGQIAVHHDHMSYACRPCGCHDGDHYLNGISKGELARSWADACNESKWLPL